MDELRQAWEGNAAAWVKWAREPGHDSYWRFHRDLFLEIVPAPSGRTLDLGCGEGRLGRDLAALGHDVGGCVSRSSIRSTRPVVGRNAPRTARSSSRARISTSSSTRTS